MKRIKKYIITLVSLILIFALSSCSDEINSIVNNNGTQSQVATSIDQLIDTENFRDGALEHILEGEVNKRGKAVGYHYEGLENTPGEVVEGTRSTPNEEGVYTAKVEVDGVKKISNGGKSSFFPEDWTAQDVVDNINEAYNDKIFINGTDNTYRGECDEGVEIEMYIDNSTGKIISAFPIY